MIGYARRSGYVVALIALIVSLSGCFESESKEQSPHPYNENADAKQDISTALAGLTGQKRVLLVFGANWCPNCRRLDATLKQPEITGYLAETFNLVKVDLGNFDKNLDQFEHYGLKKRFGIPAMAIVDRDGSVSRVIKGQEVATMHGKGREAFYGWFRTL